MRKGQLSKQNGDQKTSNEIPPPAWCDGHFCIIAEVLRILYSVVEFWWRDFRRKYNCVWICFACLASMVYSCSGLVETDYG